MNNSNSHSKRENYIWSKRSLQTFNTVNLRALREREKNRDYKRREKWKRRKFKRENRESKRKRGRERKVRKKKEWEKRDSLRNKKVQVWEAFLHFCLNLKIAKKLQRNGANQIGMQAHFCTLHFYLHTSRWLTYYC